MGHRVLIIDDSKAMREMIARTLSMSNVAIDEVRQAENGRQALELLRQSLPDIAILDLNMPEMDGEEFLAEVRSVPLFRHLPVVVVSTETNERRIRRLRLMGAEFVRKPFRPRDFCDAMHRAVTQGDCAGSPAGGQP